MSCPSCCTTRSHLVTPVPSSEFLVFHISNYKWKPGPKWMQWEWEILLLMEGVILNAFHSLLISETFTLFPFHFSYACLADLHVPCVTYLDSFSNLVFRHFYFIYICSLNILTSFFPLSVSCIHLSLLSSSFQVFWIPFAISQISINPIWALGHPVEYPIHYLSLISEIRDQISKRA